MDQWWVHNRNPVLRMKFLISNKESLEKLRQLPPEYRVDRVWSNEDGTFATVNYEDYVGYVDSE